MRERNTDAGKVVPSGGIAGYPMSASEAELLEAFRSDAPRHYEELAQAGELAEKTAALASIALSAIEGTDGRPETSERIRRNFVTILVHDDSDADFSDDPARWEDELTAYFQRTAPEFLTHLVANNEYEPRLRTTLGHARRALTVALRDEDDVLAALDRIKRRLPSGITHTPIESPLGNDPDRWEEELARHMSASSPESYARLEREGVLAERIQRLAEEGRSRVAEAWLSHEDLPDALYRLKTSLIQASVSPTQDILDARWFRSIAVDIAASCNARCPFCPRMQMPRERSRGFMDQALFDTVLRKARDGGIDTLSLYSTGEPTLHPQFDEFVLHAKELGFLVICSTNGWMMSQRERGLRAVDSLQVSVEGWDKPTYERYRTPLTFERVYDGVAYYSTVRPADQLFSLNLMLTRSTDLEQFALLWANLFDEIRFHFMLPSGEFRDAQYHPVFAEELKDDYFAFTESPSKVCGDPFEVLNIGYDGAVLLCCNDFGATMGLGSINDDLASLYAHPTVDAARQQFRRQRIGMCKGCGQTLDVSHSVKAAVQAEVERVWTKWGITSRYSFAGDLETA